MPASHPEVPYSLPALLEPEDLQLHVHSNLSSQEPLIIDAHENKQIIRNFIQVVWREQNLAALLDYWTTDCINHAMPGANNCGLEALRAYHESFFSEFSAFSNIQIEILQQITEGDRVVTYISTKGEHSGIFYGISPTGKRVETFTIWIDRLQDGKIAEHWSVSDASRLIQQLQP